MTKEEYERNVLWHIEQIRQCAKQFDPNIDHVSIAIGKYFEWANTYVDDERVSKVNYQHTPFEGEEDEQ